MTLQVHIKPHVNSFTFMYCFIFQMINCVIIPCANMTVAIMRGQLNTNIIHMFDES